MCFVYIVWCADESLCRNHSTSWCSPEAHTPVERLPIPSSDDRLFWCIRRSTNLRPTGLQESGSSNDGASTNHIASTVRQPGPPVDGMATHIFQLLNTNDHDLTFFGRQDRVG